MKIAIVCFDKDNKMYTDFYNIGEDTRNKKLILGGDLSKMDLVSVKKLKYIENSCEKIVILNPAFVVDESNGKIAFDVVLEQGLDIDKVISFRVQEHILNTRHNETILKQLDAFNAYYYNLEAENLINNPLIYFGGAISYCIKSWCLLYDIKNRTLGQDKLEELHRENMTDASNRFADAVLEAEDINNKDEVLEDIKNLTSSQLYTKYLRVLPRDTQDEKVFKVRKTFKNLKIVMNTKEKTISKTLVANYYAKALLLAMDSFGLYNYYSSNNLYDILYGPEDKLRNNLIVTIPFFTLLDEDYSFCNINDYSIKNEQKSALDIVEDMALIYHSKNKKALKANTVALVNMQRRYTESNYDALLGVVKRNIDRIKYIIKELIDDEIYILDINFCQLNFTSYLDKDKLINRVNMALHKYNLDRAAHLMVYREKGADTGELVADTITCM